MFIKLRRTAGPRGHLSLGLDSNQDCLSPLCSFLPFFRPAPSAWQEAWLPLASATRERNPFLQLRLSNVPGRSTTRPGHSRSLVHFVTSSCGQGSGHCLGSKREEKVLQRRGRHSQKGEALGCPCTPYASPSALFNTLCLCLLTLDSTPQQHGI